MQSRLIFSSFFLVTQEVRKRLYVAFTDKNPKLSFTTKRRSENFLKIFPRTCKETCHSYTNSKINSQQKCCLHFCLNLHDEAPESTRIWARQMGASDGGIRAEQKDTHGLAFKNHGPDRTENDLAGPGGRHFRSNPIHYGLKLGFMKRLKKIDFRSDD